MEKVTLRPASIEDASQLLEIYRPFVESANRELSDVSFEYVAPSVEEFAGRIRDIAAKYPYLVIEEEGKPVGYAYAHAYIAREAYQWGAEMTIYLGSQGQHKGYGSLLYTALENILKAQGVINLYACITKSNKASVNFHTKMGYRLNGDFPNSGYKHGHWLDMVWMEKQIGAYPEKPELIKSWHDLPEAVVAALQF